jgi:hypothetical protein
MNRLRILASILVLAGVALAASATDPILRWPLGLGGLALATAGWLLGLASLRGAGSRSGGLALVLAVAAVARLLMLLPAVPTSDDLYRYLWDGRVGAAGVNPFLHAPADDALTALRDEVVWPNVNHPDVPTIYPPVAQLLFRGLDAAGGTPRIPRAAAVAFDLVTLVLLGALLRRRGVRADAALMFGWCPLAIVASGGGGHVDALGVTLLMAALLVLHRPGGRAALAGGALLGLSTFVKPMAPFAAPALMLARPGRERAMLLLGGAVTLLLWLPHADAGDRLFAGFLTYARHWHFNDAVYSIVVGIGGEPLVVRRALAALSIGLAFVLPLAWRRAPLATAAGAIAAALFLSPTVHPWYVVWVAALLPFAGRRLAPGLVVWVALVPLAYVATWSERVGSGWVMPAALTRGTWGAVAAALLLAARRRSGVGD